MVSFERDFSCVSFIVNKIFLLWLAEIIFQSAIDPEISKKKHTSLGINITFKWDHSKIIFIPREVVIVRAISYKNFSRNLFLLITICKLAELFFPSCFLKTDFLYIVLAIETIDGKKFQDLFKCASKVTGGMGHKLMQKMGWTPGEGLGKDRDGPLEPLTLDVKSDRKGTTFLWFCFLYTFLRILDKKYRLPGKTGVVT